MPMKKLICLALALCLAVLCACGKLSKDVTLKDLDKVPPSANAFVPMVVDDKSMDVKTSGIEAFPNDWAKLDVGQVLEITLDVYPANIAVEDIEIVNFQSEVVNIRCAEVHNVIDRAVLTFEVVALKGGTSKICVTTADGSSSGMMNITVAEPFRGDNVLVTKGGSKFHLDSACARKNAVEISREVAEKLGYEPCKKCAGG